MGQQNFGQIQWKIFESTETEKRQRAPYEQMTGEGEHGTKLSFICNWIEQINNKASSLWLPKKSKFICDVRMARSVGVGHRWDNSTSHRRSPTTDHPAVLKQIALFSPLHCSHSTTIGVIACRIPLSSSDHERRGRRWSQQLILF